MHDDPESLAEAEFARLFRLTGSERNAAAAPTEKIQARVSERVSELLTAYDRNIADHFLEVPATGLADPERWLELEIDLDVQITEAPQRIGTFIVLRTISQGDNCSIYLAEQQTPVRRIAAIKLLHSTARRRETLRRFDTERQTIAAMRHPHIAQFFQAGASDCGHAYFAMEYVDGPQITSFSTDRDLRLRARLGLFLQVCGAITHAHQRGIVHRDLKPSNILVSVDDGTGEASAKVIDFGVAKAMARDDSAAATLTGQVVGTLCYMSPEQLRGTTDLVDTRSDVFSLGLVLFEMLTGHPVYPSRAGTPLRRPDDLAARLRATRADLPVDLDTIVAKATAIEPDQRYASAADFGADIERFLDGKPVLARNPSALYIASKFVKRHRIATGAAMLVLGVGAFAGSVVIRARAERADLAMQFAQAWLEDVLETQRTVGESPSREPKATRLVQEVRQFDSQLPGEPRVRSMLASAVTELGYVNLAKGRPEAATHNFDEALAIRRELAAIGFGRLGGMGDLSLAMIRCGDAANARNDAELRTKFYRDAFDIDQRSAAENPNDRMALSNLGWSYERLAVRMDAADALRLDFFTHQLDAFSRMNALGATGDSEHGLSSGYANLALAKRLAGLPFSIEAQRALEHGRAAVALVPDNRHLVRASIKSEFIVAEAQPDSAEMAKQFVKAIRHAEAFCDQDPHDKVGEDLLAAGVIRCDQLLLDEKLDGALLTQIREARERIRQRLSLSRPGGQP